MFSLSDCRLCERAYDHVPLTGFSRLRKPSVLLPQQGAHHEMFSMNNLTSFGRAFRVQEAFSMKKPALGLAREALNVSIK